VTEEDGRTGVLVRARPKSQGPNYLQVGLRMNSDFEGTYESNLRAALLISPLSEYGAEARVGVTIGSEPGAFAEYYHPLDIAHRWLAFGRVAYDNPDINVFDDNGDNLATYDVRIFDVDLEFGREFGNYGAVGIGLQRGIGSAKVQTGDPRQFDAFDFDRGRVYAFLSLDRLDSLYFPRSGYAMNTAYKVARETFGSDTDYTQFDFDTIGAKSFGRHAVQGGGSVHLTLEGELPVQDRYRLGGRGHLVGHRPDELTGQHYAVAFVGYTYQLAEVFGRSALVGGTLEYGNAWESRSEIDWNDGEFNASAYIGFDSWIGPMLFGYGWREGGDGVLFIEIGNPF
jgi:NTE family protein